MKGTATGLVNIKKMATGVVVTTLAVGDYLYGSLSSARTDLVGFDHIYRKDGTRVDLGGDVCKASITNMTVTSDAEPTDPGTPPPATSDIDYIEVVRKDGSRQKFVPQA